jgi:large subunit ribosomal protein L1
MKKSKRLRQAKAMVDASRDYTLEEGLELLKTFPNAKFDETVELAIATSVDPRKADQALRGTISLPKGIGKTQRVAVFCEPEQVEAAKAAGAVEAGGEDLVKKVTDGWLEFDVAIATPATMRFVGKLGRVLGPKGLMPSPKSGTVTADVVNAVTEFTAGKIEYRTDATGNIHAPMGKKSFAADDLKENIEAFYGVIRRAKPASIKGRYITGVTLGSTMSPGIRVAM